MSYTFILTLFTLFFLTGCVNTPTPTVDSKLSAFQTIQAACKKNPPKALREECNSLLADLKEENSLLQKMQYIKEDEKQESTYLTLATKEADQEKKLYTDKSLLAQQCQTLMPVIIKDDDLNSAAFCLLFEENPITLEAYKYLQKHAPRFDNNPQYKIVDEQYAKDKLQKGLKAMKAGNKRAALNAFKAASLANNAEATYLVGVIYEAKQLEKAIQWHKKAITEGVDLSKVNLARLYLRVQLPIKARQWYLSAAEDNNALAQYRLFKMDAKSKSLNAQENAKAWLVRSANNNYPQAQYIYGLQLLKQKKSDEAQQWLEKAKANGISDANIFLGQLYFEKEAYTKAYPLFIEAEGTGAANYMLAKMYENAFGVEKNSVLAYRHYKRAHELGHGNYVPDMQRVQKHLTATERNAAQYIAKKEMQLRRVAIKSCGEIADRKNVAIQNKKISVLNWHQRSKIMSPSISRQKQLVLLSK
jgi:TPR repeat protein